MSEKGSVFQKGGGGTNFEQYVQAAFIANLIIKGDAPCLPNNQIEEIGLQTTNRGWETDDLLVIAQSALGKHQLLIQCKHTLTFSEKDETFQEVMTAFWKDYNNPQFDKDNDRLIIIKQRLNNLEKNHVKGVLNFAKTHATAIDFFKEVTRIKEKKERLELFKSVLTTANSGTDLADEQVWSFLKVMDVLGYDYGNEGSVDQTYIFNLIILAKSNRVSATEQEIWNGILGLVSRLNPNGGSVTHASLVQEDLLKYFDISKINPFARSIVKLNGDSAVIIKPLKSVIGQPSNELHLDRSGLIEDINKALNQSSITFVTGKPGVGKSAAVKETLTTNPASPSLFVFRADQFNQPHLANVFANQGINESLYDLFTCLAMLPDKIIMIDSLEKLLEDTDPGNAFKQLLELLKDHPDIKLICTTRKYAIDLLIQKFGMNSADINIIDVQPLTPDDLLVVEQAFPQLNNVLKNPKIKTLLQSPKYLDFAIKSLSREVADFSNISVSNFKDILWNTLVKDVTNRSKGLPAKREDAFLDIAVHRAKEMKLFVKPVIADEEAIDKLENDEIIVQENQNRRYAPAHDILEDWALVRFVSAKFEDFPVPELFRQLGNEPAIRRAFRLWVEDHLADDPAKVNALVNATIGDKNVANFWADEVLIAVFKSDDCSAFFEAFQNKLLENNAALLNRCIHIIRTACKENLIATVSNDIMIPTGSGWKEMFKFITAHIAQVTDIRLSIINLLTDWHLTLILNNNIEEDVKNSVQQIVVNYISEIEHNNTFWQESLMESRLSSMIQLLFDLADVAKTACDILIQHAIEHLNGRRNRRSKDFYNQVINNCLSGTGHYPLIKALPNRIIEVAWKAWILDLPETNPNENPSFRSFRDHRLSADEAWGIADRLDFMPSGIYKTPVYNLLQAHPLEALKFITGFLNYSIDFYIKADAEYKHQFTAVEIELLDQTKVKQWAGWELWVAYRGLSVTHYGIESILMSLEKYLLQMAAYKNDISRSNLKFIFDYLLRNSNNITVCGVLSSVAMAYPQEVGESMLPLLGVKEFYDWDIGRATREHSAMSPIDEQISYAQQERHNFNQLPHRKRFYNGLQGFMVDYQFQIATINEQIFQIFDRLVKESEPDDIVWKKNLMEMDRRNWKAEFGDEKKETVVIKPAYDEEVSDFIDSGKDFLDKQTLTWKHLGTIDKVIKKEITIALNNWRTIYEHYINEAYTDVHFDKPATLAVIGLTYLADELDNSQQQWCVETLISIIMKILRSTFHQRYDLHPTYNIMEKETALTSFHLIINNLSAQDQSELVATIICILFAPFAEYEVRYITLYFRDTFFKNCPEFTQRIWSGLIKYAKFKKQHSYKHYHPSQEEIKASDRREQDFIESLSTTDDLSVDISTINFDDYTCYILIRALMITPFNTPDGTYESFISHLIPLILADLQRETNYSYQREKEERQLGYDQELDIKYYFSDLFIYSGFDVSKVIIRLLTSAVLKEQPKYTRYHRHDPAEFLTSLFETVIYRLDTYIANSNDLEYKNLLTANFWNAWEHLYHLIKSNGSRHFLKIILFDIDWKKESAHWQAFEGKQKIYHQMVTELGKGHCGSIIKVLSTAGEKEFLPQGLAWVVKLLKENPQEEITLINAASERLVKRLYANHISVIKKDPGLINDFLYLLNKMIDLGSSPAYFFRENVITYKASA